MILNNSKFKWNSSNLPTVNSFMHVTHYKSHHLMAWPLSPEEIILHKSFDPHFNQILSDMNSPIMRCLIILSVLIRASKMYFVRKLTCSWFLNHHGIGWWWSDTFPHRPNATVRAPEFNMTWNTRPHASTSQIKWIKGNESRALQRFMPVVWMYAYFGASTEWRVPSLDH